MTPSELESIVAEYARSHLSPTGPERTSIGERYDDLKEFLTGRTFQTGSYARFTATTPVHDLDVIYLLPDDIVRSVRGDTGAIDFGKLDIHNILASLASQLRDHYESEARVEVQPHSVGLFFEDEFSIDVVPSLPADSDMVWVPEIARQSVARRRELYRSWETPPGPNWIKSHPRGYIAQASTVDQRSKGRFRKAAKTLKRWRWSKKDADDTFRLKSFHLELAVTRHVESNSNVTCVASITKVVAALPDLIARPQFPDLADSAKFVDEYVSSLTTEDRAKLGIAFAEARAAWEDVLGATTRSEAITALERFLGVQVAPSREVRAGSPFLGFAPTSGREPGEQFLSDYGIEPRLTHRVGIDATVTKDGFRPFSLRGYLRRLFKLRRLEFRVVSCNVPRPYAVKWKVKNRGAEAARKGDLRGQIYDDDGRERRVEHTKYWGDHYVECYVIKGGVCVAADHIDVRIGSD